MTQFAVATEKQAVFLRELVSQERSGSATPVALDRQSLHTVFGQLVSNGYVDNGKTTSSGRLALELAVAMEGEKLTPAMARALDKQITPPRVFRSLVKAGLLDEGDALTSKGERVASIFRKYHVEF